MSTSVYILKNKNSNPNLQYVCFFIDIDRNLGFETNVIKTINGYVYSYVGPIHQLNFLRDKWRKLIKTDYLEYHTYNHYIHIFRNIHHVRLKYCNFCANKIAFEELDFLK